MAIARLGSAFFVDETKNAAPDAPFSTVLVNGSFVATWTVTDIASDSAIVRARVLFTADGAAKGEEFDVSAAAGDVFSSQLAALTKGGFVVTWDSGDNARLRIYDDDGTAKTGEIVVDPNEHTANLTAARLGNGNFLAAWNSFPDGGGENGEIGIFNAAGTEIGAPLQFADATTIRLTPLTGGGAIAMWQTSDQDTGTDSDYSYRLFTAAGRPTGHEMHLKGTAALQPSVTALANGGFAMAWRTTDSAGHVQFHDRLFSATGVAGAAHLVATATTGSDQFSITALADGRFALAWDATVPNAHEKVLDGLILNADGTADGSVFRIMGPGYDTTLWPTVSALHNGLLTVTWSDFTTGERIDGAIYDPTAFTGTAAADRWTGGSFADRIGGGGGNDVLNGLAGNDHLDGGAGNDTLNGGAGSDVLTGGAGNDVFVVDSARDKVVEAAQQGTDVVRSTVSVTLAANVENLVLLGTGAVNGTGNVGANVLTGNAAANVLRGGAGGDHLDGGLGADTLTGGAAPDVFVFDTKLGAGNIDHVTDFTIGSDKIDLAHAVFTKLAVGHLALGAFFAGTKAHDADDHILYNAANGHLSYDPDGTGALPAVQFATLAAHLGLTAADFVVT